MNKQSIYQTAKQKSSQEVFDKIAPTYNILNKILSLGIDTLWRNSLIKHIPQNTKNIIDLATGTGDMLFMYNHLKNISSITGIDLSENMLSIARQKIQKKKLLHKIQIFHQDMQNTQFVSNSFDCASIAFGIRNVPDVSKCLSEVYRILAPQGKLLILELTVPTNVFLKKIYLVYLRYILPLFGGIVSKNFFAYQYLNGTIESFPQYKTFCLKLQESKFTNVTYKKLWGGICTLYIAKKN